MSLQRLFLNMAFALLFGVPDGQAHVPLCVQSHGQRSTSARMHLPKPDWFKKLLLASASANEAAPSNNQVCATVLVRLGPGAQYNGPLTQWTWEELLLWEHHHRPLDAFSLTIQQVVALDPPLPLKFAKTFLRLPRHDALYCLSAETSFADLQGRGTLAAPAGQAVASLTSEQMRVRFEASLAAWTRPAECTVAVSVPQPILNCIRLGLWKHLLCRRSWAKQRLDTANAFKVLHSALQYPLPDCVIAAAWGQGCLGRMTELETVLTPAFANDLASNLRAWAPTIINGSPSEEEAKEATFELEQAVTHLDNHSFLSQLSAGPRTHFDVKQIARVLVAVMNLKSKPFET